MDDNVFVATEEVEEKEAHVSEPSEEFFQRIENRLPLDVRVPRRSQHRAELLNEGRRFGVCGERQRRVHGGPVGASEPFADRVAGIGVES